jgi:ATP-dependent DNA helicase RecQ
MSSALDDPVRQAPATARQVLQDVFGYPAFRGQQAAIVDHVVAGGDALVLMPTGGGKSLCYQVPAIVRQRSAAASRWW